MSPETDIVEASPSGRDTRGRFIKGNTAATGRRPGTDVQAMSRFRHHLLKSIREDHLDKALHTILDVMENSRSDICRLRSCELLLDRATGVATVYRELRLREQVEGIEVLLGLADGAEHTECRVIEPGDASDDAE